jgi:hypothetical protein
MNISELDQALPVVGGSVTFTTSTLDGLLRDFLIEYNAGQPLIIAAAAKTVTSSEVIIDGTTSFLRVAAAAAHAVFTLQTDGSVESVITISLSAGWTFSTSFPDLPPFRHQGTTALSVLDMLTLISPAYVAATASGTHSSGAPLQTGLNFVAEFDPGSVSGLFASLLGGGNSLLYGTIDLTQSTPTPALTPLELPWSTSWEVPGISLEAALGADITLGELRITGLTERIYSPSDTAWLADNVSYSPLLAITGTMSVPSASISADVTVIVSVDSDSVTFAFDFDGISIGKLAELLDLVGGDDLETVLPAEIRNALGSLALESGTLGLAGSFTGDAVQWVAPRVGFPGVVWNVLPGVFSVGNLAAYFMVCSPFSATGARFLSVTFSGELEVAGVSAEIITTYPGFTTLATATETISLSLLFNELAPLLPSPPTLDVDVLRIEIIPDQSYRFTASAAETPEWTLALGSFGMTIGSPAVDIWDEGAGMQGSFSGTLLFDDTIETLITYDTPGTFTILSEFPETRLSQIIARLDEIGVTVPDGFDVVFSQSYILIEEDAAGNLMFSVSAVVGGLGLVAFTFEKSGGWGYATGIQLDTGGLANLPGLASLARFEDFVGLEEILMLVSSLDDPGFTFPDMARFNAEPVHGKSMPLPAQANGVVRGVNVYAQLDAAKNDGFRILAAYLGIPLDGSAGVTIAVSAPNPVTTSKLFVTVDLDLYSNTHIRGQLGVLVVNDEFGVFLDGEVKTSIEGAQATFSVVAEVLPTGVLISGSMVGTIEFDPVRLSNVGIVIGLNDAAVPSFGFAATIDVQDFESSIAVFFDSVYPDKSMFAGAVSDLTLLSVATSIAGQSSVSASIADALAQFGLKSLDGFTMPSSVTASLDARDIDAIRAAFGAGGVSLPASFDQIFFVTNTRSQTWHLTDLSTMWHYELKASGAVIDVRRQPQFYCAPQMTYIGAIQYPAGVHVLAEIDAFLVRAQIKVIIESRVGIAADVGADPIEIVSSNFFTITGAGPNGGPMLSMSTYTQTTESDPLLRDPHFFLSGTVRILGSDVADLTVTIAASGLQFEFRSEVAPATNVDLRGSVAASLDLSVAGGFTAGIDETLDAGELGKIHVTTTVDGSLDIGTLSGVAHATVEGEFVFQGEIFTIPPLSLDITTAALANLPATLWNQIADILEKWLLDSAKWLQCVAAGIVEGAAQSAEDVGRILDCWYHLSGDAIADETASILHYGTETVTEALEGAGYTAEETAKILEDAGYAAEDIADAVETVFTGSEHADFSLGHTDVPASAHGDVAAIHTDIPSTGHSDTHSSGHVDIPKVHDDTGGNHDDAKEIGIHYDVKYPHTDSTLTPHSDTPATPFVDIPGSPHVDEKVSHTDEKSPHVDSGTHVDTN